METTAYLLAPSFIHEHKDWYSETQKARLFSKLKKIDKEYEWPVNESNFLVLDGVYLKDEFESWLSTFLNDVDMFIQPELDKLNQIGYTLLLTDVFYTKNCFNQSTGIHHHTRNTLDEISKTNSYSFVYYTSAIKNPPQKLYFFCKTASVSFKVEIEIKENTLIWFPSWMEHCTDRNLSEEETKYCISGNYLAIPKKIEQNFSMKELCSGSYVI